MPTPQGNPPARILAVDDEPQNLELLEALLVPAGYEVLLAGGGQEGLTMAQRERPDLILLDLMMPGVSGFEVCARLKTDPETRDIPVLFVTALSTVGDKERALAMGGDDILTKPFQRPELLARVEALLKVGHLNRDLDEALASLHAREADRHARRPQGRPLAPPASSAPVILAVDDDALARQLYADALHEKGYLVHTADSGAQALEIARREPIDVVLLDILMPGMSGLEVLASLGELIPDSPVIIITAHPTSENAIAALRLGAFDFIVKGFKTEMMLATVSRALERRRLAIRNQRMIQQLEAKVHELLSILREHAEEFERLQHMHPAD